MSRDPSLFASVIDYLRMVFTRGRSYREPGLASKPGHFLYKVANCVQLEIKDLDCYRAAQVTTG